MKARLILAIRTVASWIEGLTDDHHLVTDPACKRHVAPRPGSRLDRASRGHSCTPCMASGAVWSHPFENHLPSWATDPVNGGRDA